MALVTITDLQNLIRRTLPADEQAAVQLLIDTMEVELEYYCNRPITSKTSVDEKATIGETGYVFLKNSPVISVQAITYQTTPATVFTGTYTVISGGLLFSASYSPTDILVDYTAGLTDPANRGLKSILLARLSRIYAKVHDDALGVSSLTQEGYNAAYLDEGWTEQELKIADRQRRRTVRV